MRKLLILGWILLPCNIAGLVFCIHALQTDILPLYLIAVVFFIAQTVYLAKSLRLLKQVKKSRKTLESAVKDTGILLAKYFRKKP